MASKICVKHLFFDIQKYPYLTRITYIYRVFLTMKLNKVSRNSIFFFIYQNLKLVQKTRMIFFINTYNLNLPPFVFKENLMSNSIHQKKFWWIIITKKCETLMTKKYPRHVCKNRPNAIKFNKIKFLE